MRTLLLILILGVIALSWNFVFSPKQVILTDRARVLVGLSGALDYKTAVREFWQAHGELPQAGDLEQAGVPVRVDLSQSIAETIRVGADGPGIISVYFKGVPDMESPADVDGRKINLIPRVMGEDLVWTCLGNVPMKLLPQGCSSFPVAAGSD